MEEFAETRPSAYELYRTLRYRLDQEMNVTCNIDDRHSGQNNNTGSETQACRWNNPEMLIIYPKWPIGVGDVRSKMKEKKKKMP